MKQYRQLASFPCNQDGRIWFRFGAAVSASSKGFRSKIVIPPGRAFGATLTGGFQADRWRALFRMRPRPTRAVSSEAPRPVGGCGTGKSIARLAWCWRRCIRLSILHHTVVEQRVWHRWRATIAACIVKSPGGAENDYKGSTATAGLGCVDVDVTVMGGSGTCSCQDVHSIGVSRRPRYGDLQWPEAEAPK
jgi:hypothetical protein